MNNNWIINPHNIELASIKTDNLISKNNNYMPDSTFFMKSEQYRKKFLAEIEFCNFLKQNGYTYHVLTQDDEAANDTEFIIEDRKVVLITQPYYSGTLKPSWAANLNLESYKIAEKRGIEVFSYVFYNPIEKEMTYVGNVNYKDVPRLGSIVLKGEKFKNGYECSADCYNIELHNFFIPKQRNIH